MMNYDIHLETCKITSMAAVSDVLEIIDHHRNRDASDWIWPRSIGLFAMFLPEGSASMNIPRGASALRCNVCNT